MKSINTKDNRIQTLESRKLELESEISKLKTELATLSSSTSDIRNEYIKAAAKHTAGIETNSGEVEKRKTAVDQTKGSIERIAQIQTELQIKETAIKEINTLLYRMIPSESYAESVQRFIADAEKAIEKFNSSKSVFDAVADIIAIDARGNELNANQSKVWKVYIPADFGYLFTSVNTRFTQNIKLNFDELKDAEKFKAKIYDEYVRFFVSAINYCKAHYSDFIFNRFEDEDLCNYLLVSSNVSDEDREFLSYWRADIFSK